jgi:hypothetical protein
VTQKKKKKKPKLMQCNEGKKKPRMMLNHWKEVGVEEGH